METWKAFLEAFAGRLRNAARVEEPGTSVPGEEDVPEVIKEPPMEIVGRVMTADQFVRYVENLDFSPPLPKRVFLHHTWRPTREQWRGMGSILAMKDYYERQLWTDDEGRLHEGWTAGPHLFVADDGIWLFSDLRWDGVGVYGHNYCSRHIEMVGNYDHQLPRGATLENTIVALGVLHERLGLATERLNFHRDFSTKSCPGWAVQKTWIIPLVAAWIEDYRRKREDAPGMLRRSLTEMVRELLVPTNPDAALAKAGHARGLLGALTQEIPLEIDDQGYIVQFFAEALLVPVNEWGKVESLLEYERARQGQGEGNGVSDGAGGGGPCMPTSPKDPFPFEGDLR